MYEDLVKALRYCNTGGDGCLYCPYAYMAGCIGLIREKAADAIEGLERQVFDMSSLIGDYSEKTRWIPVTERLPEEDCQVLAYYGFNHGDGDLGMMFMQVMDYYARDPVPHFQHEGLNGLTVTHYMPLPEPPKEAV